MFAKPQIFYAAVKPGTVLVVPPGYAIMTHTKDASTVAHRAVLRDNSAEKTVALQTCRQMLECYPAVRDPSSPYKDWAELLSSKL